MDALLVSLIGISVLCTFYGIIKIALFARERSRKESAFDHRVRGRSGGRTNNDRRTRTEVYPQV
jgi:hypothetical protein